MKSLGRKKSESSKYWMEGVAFGLADGIICCLGLIIGVAEATANFPLLERRSLILASGILGGLANAFGNSIGFFLSQETERSVQIREERLGMKTRVHTKREVLMSGILSFSSTLFALLVLITPFIFLNIETSIILTFILGTFLSFSMGFYVGRISKQNPLKTGLKYAILAVVGALISHEIGDLLSMIIPIHRT
jgi:predicted membrane protein (TIGR00267 family)